MIVVLCSIICAITIKTRKVKKVNLKLVSYD